MKHQSKPGEIELPLDVLDQIDRICDKFEAAWERGGPPRIEDYLDAIAATHRSALLGDLLAAELDARSRRGESPEHREYVGRFPSDTTVIELAFAATPARRADGTAGAAPRATADGPGSPACEAPPSAEDRAGRTLMAEVPSPVPASAARTRDFGDFELLRVLGRGGMGIVYQARQRSLNRAVAVKMIRGGTWADEDEVRRFRNEAEAVANLDHPQIVTIYEVGEHDGQHYFSMKLVEGSSLAERLPHYTADPRATARLVAEVARAVHHAHQRGILHRDLKPSNILIDRDGRPHVTDFGLAKRIQGNGDVSVSGSILGTPSYMSPEQASGRRSSVTTAADVYGLGAVLYATLTGRPPLEGESVVETLEMVRERPPERPGLINRRVSRDLETVCLKCLEKDPRRRYDSAAGLAEDLGRFLRSEPVLARRIGGAERTWRWFRQNPALALAGSAAAVLLAATVAVSVDAAFRHARAAARLRAEQTQTRAALRQIEQLATDLALERGRSLCEQGNVSQGMLWMARAFELAPGDGADSRQQVIRTALSAWRAELSPLKAVFPSQGPILAVAFSPDGQTIATASGDRTAQLWRATDGIPFGRPMAHRDEVVAVAFSPDGQTIVTASRDHTARLWRTVDGAPLGTVLRHGDEIWAAAFSPDGRTIATASRDHTARLWRATDGAPLGQPLSHQGMVRSVAFSPDGQTIVTASWDHTARLWRTADGAPIGVPMVHRQEVRAAEFSPDGRTIVTASWDHTARLWKAADGAPIGAPMLHEGRVVAVAFSPDGQAVVTASWDHTARLWRTADGAPIGRPLTHQDEVFVAAFSPDGQTVVTASRDHTARLWRTTEGTPIGTAINHQDFVLAVAFSPDGRTVLTGSKDQTARLWQVAQGTLTGRPMTHATRINGVGFSPDGQTIATASDDHTARLWRSDGTPVGQPMTHQRGVNAVAFSPDGQSVATAGDDFTARFWRAIDGTPLNTVLKHRAEVNAVAFSPDGQTIATASDDRTARLWNTADGTPIGRPMTHRLRVSAVAFSPDGRTIVTGSRDRTARLWRAADGTPIGGPLPHSREVTAVAFSPDGQSVATADWDQTARLWRAADGTPIGQSMSHEGPVVALAFSPDGQTIVTASWDKSVRFWKAADGTSIGRPLIHPDEVRAVAFRGDGRALATATRGGIARLWQIPPLLNVSPDEAMLWVQGISGLELDGNQAVRVLDAETWQVRRRLLQAREGRPGL